jgi:DUF1365 family protein
LYLGSVRHRRAKGPKHRFSYRVWYSLLDLDRIPEIARSVPFFSHNRFNLTAFDDRDHMGPEPLPVRSKLEAWLRARDVIPADGRISVLTQLRLLGHVFNPVSFYYCRDGIDRLRYVVAEVNNTFGETYCYLLHADGRSGVRRHEESKVLHVSPFQPMDGIYRFQVTPPEESLSVHIEVVRNGDRQFDATLTADRLPMTGGSLLRTVARHPHTGLRTLTLIHFEALRLWLKGAPFFPKPSPPPGAWRTRHGKDRCLDTGLAADGAVAGRGESD